MAPARSHLYALLNHNAAEIRLVTFERTNAGAIRCRLHVFPMSKCPAYVTISYAWGKEPPRRTIYLNGNKVRLRENIYQALKSVLRLRARNREGDRPLKRTIQLRGLPRKAVECEYFWIDSICINQACVTERNRQVGLMGQIFSNADFAIAWLGPESDRSAEVMQAISNYEPSPEPVSFSFSPPSLPQHLRDILDIFGGLSYWSRVWIVQEIILAKDVLVSWGNQFLPWYKVTNVGLSRSGKVPVGFASFEHISQLTHEYDEDWVRLVMEKERKKMFLRGPERQVGDTRSIKPASLYALIVQFAGHGCSDPRDKVIGLLGLAPDDAAHLADYSTQIDEYFKEVCKYVFTTAQINGEWAKTRFQSLLGENLGLPASVYSVRVSNP